MGRRRRGNDEENRAAYRRAGRVPRHRVFPTGVGRERTGDARRLPESQRAKNARVEGEIIHYGDDVGYSALFIGGRYPQPFMKNQPGRELCLYQRATQKAAVQAVEGE